MSFKQKNELILSIETTIGGGSLALFSGEALVGSWSGQPEISKAEDVLKQISEIFEDNDFDLKQIGKIIVSKCEGSATGGKIGSAIAKGLAKAVGCLPMEISVFESLLAETTGTGNYLNLIPAGKDQIKWRRFRCEENSIESDRDIETSRTDEFVENLKSFGNGKLILAPPLTELHRIISLGFKDISIHLSRRNLAELNGLLFLHNRVR